MTHKLRIVFIGTEAWAIPSLEALIEQHEVVAVITKPDAPAGRGHILTPSPIKEVAVRCKIPAFEPFKLSDITGKIIDLKADLGVVIAYGKIIPDEIIDAFAHGIFNCHPSALPAFRGPSPIEAAILADEPITVSIIQLSSEMDAGDILDQAELPGQTHDLTAPEIYNAAGLVGAELLIGIIRKLQNKTLVPTPQDHSLATFSTKISKADGLIDWNKPAIQIEREIRAYAGWPGSKTSLNDSDITITRAHVAAIAPARSIPCGTPLLTTDGSLAFQTSQGMLVVDRLKPAGKRDMTSGEYLAGHPLAND
jgi:methionyl-tRNA formyltransferase